jgi:hypothetical protein
MQPNDVGIQRVFKHIVKVEAANWFMQETQKQLQANPNIEVKLPTEIGPLRDATVGWVTKASDYFKANPEVVKQVSFPFCYLSKPLGLITILVMGEMPNKKLEFVL